MLIGPATRLDPYVTGQRKGYVATIVFGSATTTDDREGKVIKTGPIPSTLSDASFAEAEVASMVGAQKQLPPAYSALKVNGKKACDEARRGHIIPLEPREVEVYSASLLSIEESSQTELKWNVSFEVSSGTYIRSLARDMGMALGVPAHLGGLRRTSVGSLSLEECVSLTTLEQVKTEAAIDPVCLLGFRCAFVEGELAMRTKSGAALPASLELYRYPSLDRRDVCSCTSGISLCSESPCDQEPISIVCDHRLQALYRYDAQGRCFKAACVFAIGVYRG